MGFSILSNIATGFDFLLEPVDVENTFQCCHREQENSEYLSCVSLSNLVSCVDHSKSRGCFACSSEYKLEKIVCTLCLLHQCGFCCALHKYTAICKP